VIVQTWMSVWINPYVDVTPRALTVTEATRVRVMSDTAGLVRTVKVCVNH